MSGYVHGGGLFVIVGYFMAGLEFGGGTLSVNKSVLSNIWWMGCHTTKKWTWNLLILKWRWTVCLMYHVMNQVKVTSRSFGVVDTLQSFA